MVAHNLAYRFSTVLRTFVLDVLERIQTARARLLHSVPGSCAVTSSAIAHLAVDLRRPAPIKVARERE